MASLVPKTKENVPKITTRMFFQIKYFPGPTPGSQYVMTSIIAGAIRPRMEKQNAPMTPIKGLIWGTAAAIDTHTVTIIVLMM